MNDTSPTVSFPEVFSNLRRHRLVISVTVLLAVAASIALSASTTPRYEATASVGFNDESADLQALGTPAAPSFQPDKVAAAQAERIARPDIIARVRASVRTTLTPVQLQDAVSTQVESATNLVSIKTEASTARLAADLANGFANAIKADVTDRAVKRYTAAGLAARRRANRLKGTQNAARRVVYEDQASRLLSLASITHPVDVVRSAEVPSGPATPKPVRNAVLAALLGLILGLGIAFLRQTLDRRLREPEDVQAYLGLPSVGSLTSSVLGTTPMAGANGKQPSDIDVEPFKIMRTNVGVLSLNGDIKTMLVTSPLPAEGKSTVAIGLAWAQAKTGKRTLLVDCDLRRPMIGTRLGLPPNPGLTGYLLDDAKPADILQLVDSGGGDDSTPLACITAGRQVPNYPELLASERFREFLSQVSQAYDCVVLDTAPLLPVSDTLGLLPQVDGILLCVRLGQTTSDQALAAKSAIERFPPKPTGLVVTAADRSRLPYYVGYVYDRVGDEAA